MKLWLYHDIDKKIKKEKKPLSLFGDNLDSLKQHMCCVKFGPVILAKKKREKNSSMHFLLFCYHFRLECSVSFLQTNLHPFTQGCFVPSMIVIVMCFWRIFFFRFCQCGVLFRFYLSLERAWSFIQTNLKSLYPSKSCAKFGWN